MTADAQITFLPSSDLQRSRTFYERILGLVLVTDQGMCHIYRVAKGAFLGVCERETVTPTDGVIVTLVSDGVDGWCDQIIEAGGTIERGPEHSERFGIYHAFLRDPDGNLLEIQRFDDPEWSSSAS
ncbi:MAG: VOC family protein [Actinomycetota bacterium]|nr:VOC family protein [Actinomycetota bacterium]